MKSNRAAALGWVYHDEGGYAERDIEPGGAVNKGISFAEFKAWWHVAGKSGEPTFADLKAMPQSVSDAIYDKFYLAPCHFDDLPRGPDYVVLDGFINGGGLTILQRAIGLKAEHPEVARHVFGPVTLWAAAHREPRALIDALTTARLARNETLKRRNEVIKPGSQKTWRQVWDERTGLVHQRALAMLENK